jgi:hypothetical protein
MALLSAQEVAPLTLRWVLKKRLLREWKIPLSHGGIRVPSILPDALFESNRRSVSRSTLAFAPVQTAALKKILCV